MSRWQLLSLAASAILLSVIALALWGSPASAYTSDQAQRGAEVFAQRCAVCHGDVGQGLAKWRPTWLPQDQNCATAKCHGMNHPPEGFYMPVDAPPIIGEGTLIRYQTASDLFAYISKKMPFSEPGVLSSEDYWALTAFLIREHGVLPDGAWLGASNAQSLSVNPSSSASISLPVIVAAAGLLIMLSLVLLARRRQRARAARTG